MIFYAEFFNVEHMKLSLSKTTQLHNLEIVSALSDTDTDASSSEISLVSCLPGTFTLQIQLILFSGLLNKIVPPVSPDK